MDITRRISYIIGYRESNNERESALFFVLSYLRECFPHLEIIVVEQDEKSRFSPPKSLNVKHLFIENSGLYNHCKSFNFGARNTKRAIFFFGCSDIFLGKDDFLTCFYASEKFEATTPNRIEASNVEITNLKTHTFNEIGKRPLFTFAGGLLSLTRTAFEKIGGWDERFEGWGGDDDAMSHIILQKLKTKTFYLPMYHIDHPRKIAYTDEQQNYVGNRDLSDEISTKYGAAIDHYVEYLKKANQPYADNENAVPKQLKFVLAVMTYNRLDYLKALVNSFLSTRNQNVDWQIIIADDGSTDGTKQYLEELSAIHEVLIIPNNRVGGHRQVNTILKVLSEMEFDVCFRCDDDLIFRQVGWDNLYWQTIQRTGYEHLIFYDRSWQPHINVARPIQFGALVSHCLTENIQGAFYTLTPAVLKAVGFYDEQQFGRRGWGHVDFSFRSCRAGFNVLSNPFDVVGSNDYLQLQSVTNYKGSISLKHRTKFNSKETIERKKRLIWQNRVYVPYNENFYYENEGGIDKTAIDFTKKAKRISLRKADSTFYPERGISGFIGFLLKRFYNLMIDLRLFFIPKGIKYLGRILNKIGLDLMHMDE